MEIGNRGSEQIEGGGHSMTRKFFSGLALAIALLVAGAGVLYGQEAPEPPEPPAPPASTQVFVLNDGTVHLGVTLGDVTTEKAQELKLPAVAGAIVNSVQKDSAAAKAGMEKGDAIMEFDGVRVRSSAELRRLIRETPAGRTVAIKLVRGGKTLVRSAKLEASTNHYNYNFNMPEIHIPPMDFPEFSFTFGAHRATLGISADDLTPQLAQYFGVKQGKGVLISEVTKGGAADKAGLKAGDVIVQVDGKPISGVEDLRSALNDNFTGDTRKVSLTIVRDHHEQTVNADLTRSQAGEKHTSSAAGPSYGQAPAQIRAQADQQRAQADQLRALAESQHALVRAEVLKQQQHVQAEWQRQLQEQMRSLKDQLKQLQNLHVALHQDGEI
ncbi:MAG: PDZ domain-containing protein [Terriglobia bacterium]|jgi:membrane-associated protease RseP (regulator of RpoE activity)